ncbi:hypothetical protein T265_02096 [Opisthorchis viverrini]|uniref:TIR domain-containing protein n=1 Tax=Opisthorchis viverrini TaxID=6198 RepID=A0A075A7U0_OPIVI|nr:hypothetical protein T265_02096 [Opisthorchis viverrini]KER31730.1 hypothetical protein T265_02096 [Opisthorchis viverrini]
MSARNDEDTKQMAMAADKLEPNDIPDRSLITVPKCRNNFTWEEIQRFIDEAITNLIKLEELNDLTSLYRINKHLSRTFTSYPYLRENIAEYLNERRFPSLAVKLIKRLNNLGVFSNDGTWFSSFYLYSIAWSYSDISNDFTTALAVAGISHLLNLNIGHPPYLENLNSKNVYFLIKASLSLLHNIVKIPGNRDMAQYTVGRDALLNILTFQREPSLRCLASLCLAHTLDEVDVPMALNQAPNLIHQLLSYMYSASHSARRKYHGYTVAEFMTAVSAFAVNENTHRTLLATEMERPQRTGRPPLPSMNFLKFLLKLTDVYMSAQLNEESEREANAAIRVIHHLVFSPNLKENGALSELISRMTELSRLFTVVGNPNEALYRTLEVFTWQRSQPIASMTFESYTLPKPTECGPIVMSYAPINAPAAGYFIEQLRAASLPVWNHNRTNVIDSQIAQEMGMSALAAFSGDLKGWLECLDQATVMIVCLSDAYRLSPGCRVELQYFLSINSEKSPKVLIYILMPPKFHPNGWTARLPNISEALDFTHKRTFVTTLRHLVSLAGRPYAITVADEPLDSLTYDSMEANKGLMSMDDLNGLKSSSIFLTSSDSEPAKQSAITQTAEQMISKGSPRRSASPEIEIQRSCSSSPTPLLSTRSDIPSHHYGDIQAISSVLSRDQDEEIQAEHPNRPTPVQIHSPVVTQFSAQNIEATVLDTSKVELSTPAHDLKTGEYQETPDVSDPIGEREHYNDSQVSNISDQKPSVKIPEHDKSIAQKTENSGTNELYRIQGEVLRTGALTAYSPTQSSTGSQEAILKESTSGLEDENAEKIQSAANEGTSADPNVRTPKGNESPKNKSWDVHSSVSISQPTTQPSGKILTDDELRMDVERKQEELKETKMPDVNVGEKDHTSHLEHSYISHLSGIQSPPINQSIKASQTDNALRSDVTGCQPSSREEKTIDFREENDQPEHKGIEQEQLVTGTKSQLTYRSSEPSSKVSGVAGERKDSHASKVSDVGEDKIRQVSPSQASSLDAMKSWPSYPPSRTKKMEDALGVHVENSQETKSVMKSDDVQLKCSVEAPVSKVDEVKSQPNNQQPSASLAENILMSTREKPEGLQEEQVSHASALKLQPPWPQFDNALGTKTVDSRDNTPRGNRSQVAQACITDTNVSEIKSKIICQSSGTSIADNALRLNVAENQKSSKDDKIVNTDFDVQDLPEEPSSISQPQLSKTSQSMDPNLPKQTKPTGSSRAAIQSELNETSKEAPDGALALETVALTSILSRPLIEAGLAGEDQKTEKPNAISPTTLETGSHVVLSARSSKTQGSLPSKMSDSKPKVPPDSSVQTLSIIEDIKTTGTGVSSLGTQVPTEQLGLHALTDLSPMSVFGPTTQGTPTVVFSTANYDDIVQPHVRQWTVQQVSEWFTNKGLSHLLRKLCGDIDGIVLSQLAYMRHWAPEYFAKSIRSDLGLGFVEALRLVEALQELTKRR